MYILFFLLSYLGDTESNTLPRLSIYSESNNIIGSFGCMLVWLTPTDLNNISINFCHDGGESLVPLHACPQGSGAMRLRSVRLKFTGFLRDPSLQVKIRIRYKHMLNKFYLVCYMKIINTELPRVDKLASLRSI